MALGLGARGLYYLTMKVSWVDGWEWLLPTEPEALPEEEGTDA